VVLPKAMVTIELPQVLRTYVDGVAQAEITEGSTVYEVINDFVGERCPAIRSYFLKSIAPNRALSNFMNFYINGTDIRALKGAETRVTDRDVIKVVPAIAGG
jgi:molybdopterin synthase sulfur carrier subunit